MKKFYFLIILLIIIGCSKKESVKEITKEENIPENLTPNDFVITLSDITSDSVFLNWSEAVDPDGDSVTYAIFLNNNIIVDNLKKLNYEISGLTELTNYSGKILAKDSHNNVKEKLFTFTTLKYYLQYSKIFDFADNGTGGAGIVKSMIKTKANNYVVFGSEPRGDYAHQPMALKIDLEGNKLWQKSFDFRISGHTRPKFIQTLDDGLVFVAGRYIFKTDIDGNLIWQREIQSYNTGENSAQIQSVKEDSGGFLYVVGGRGSIIDLQKVQEAVLTKLDSNGNILLEKTYGNSIRSFFNDVVISPSNDIIILGSTETSGLSINDLGSNSEQIDFWIIKTNLNGDVEFEKTFDGSGYDFPEQLINTTDGNFAFVGYSWGAYDIGKARLFKIDINGNEIWSSIYNSGNLSMFSMDETSDGNFVTVGYNFGDTSNSLVILKYDSLGNVIWEKSHYKYQRESVGYSILQTDDEGYLICSQIDELWPDGNEGIWVIKTDPDGNFE